MKKTGPEKKSGKSKSPDNRGPDNRGSTVLLTVQVSLFFLKSSALKFQAINTPF